jgi:hypothetical protein
LHAGNPQRQVLEAAGAGRLHGQVSEPTHNLIIIAVIMNIIIVMITKIDGKCWKLLAQDGYMDKLVRTLTLMVMGTFVITHTG